ncbi:MAG: ABC transporter permease subunit [Ruminococcaceae bacterium]|nr:ABC transporter permease subunit [Oscillospiraceae bacterium]
MSKNNKNPSKGFFATLKRWGKRMFFGGSNALADELELTPEEAAERARQADIEEVVSPTRQIVRNFLRRKGAVVAMCVVVAMFLFVFIAPEFMPYYDDAYTEPTQKSVAPGFRMMNVPSELKDDIKMIDSYGTFSVGLSNAGKVYVWGETRLGTTGIDIADIPEAVTKDKIAFVSAGIDHIIAISEGGKVYGWGSNRLGQFGTESASSSVAPMPEELINGTIDVDNIKELECGYQVTSILMKDGSFYIWGNKNAYQNLEYFLNLSAMPLEDISFTLNNIVAVRKGGDKSLTTGMKNVYNKVRTDMDDATPEDIKKFVGDRKIVAATTANTIICLTLSDGSVCFVGDAGPTYGYKNLNMPKGVTAVDVQSGTYHFTVLGSDGKVYSCGREELGQCKVSNDATGATRIFSGAFQNYAIDENNDLVAKWGLSGYLFGTDTTGAPIFERVVNAGKMTMTVGAIAVIISTIIGIIIGCLSGYFGGKVDILLMRLAEIVSAIPFLPFAMLLSAIMGRMALSELTRIMIIMCILGVLSWPGLARIVRGQVLVAREQEYVTAAKAMGVKESIIAFKHILPNVISVILVTLTLDFAGCMLTESSLSYLGFGVQYPRPTWGNMLTGANNELIISNFWWQWLFPAIFLAVTTVCINIIGDTLRDVMDPKSTSER